MSILEPPADHSTPRSDSKELVVRPGAELTGPIPREVDWIATSPPHPQFLEDLSNAIAARQAHIGAAERVSEHHIVILEDEAAAFFGTHNTDMPRDGLSLSERLRRICLAARKHEIVPLHYYFDPRRFFPQVATLDAFTSNPAPFFQELPQPTDPS